MSADTTLPTIAVTLTHRIADFDAWQKAFEAHAAERRKAGILGHHIMRSADQPELVSVYLPANDRSSLERFLASGDLEAQMRKVFVTEMPQWLLLVPQERRTVSGRAPAAASVTFRVEDYARWKASFDAGRERRDRASIVGYSVSRTLAEPNRVFVYLQAESAEQLRAMLGSSEFAANQQRAGVRSTPEVRFLEETGHTAQYAS
jgi:hypothetical protein